MSTLIDTSTLYDSLRALGPVMADEVPDSLASRLASADLDAGKVKEAIAVYAKLANEGTLQDFTSAIEQGGMAYALGLGAGKLEAAAPTKGCCGHTWEGTCTKWA